jgi:class 3 adenylate cyclase
MTSTTLSTAGGLDDRLAGTRQSLFWRELLGNAAHFPLANLFFEIVTEGREIFTAPDAYVLVFAALAQAWISSGWQRKGISRPMLSNLLGPVVYLVLETLIEGTGFFEQPNHLIYLAFGIGVGAIRWALVRATAEKIRLALLLAEGLSRGVILLLMYAALEARPETGKVPKAFWVDESHQYIALALIALGLLIGLFAYFEQRTLAILRETADRLRLFSEWSFGRDLTSRAVSDADALSLQAIDVSVLFIDLRGFTAWSETRPPREVVDMLNEFYALIDQSLGQSANVIKLKFTADEAMIVIRDPSTAIRMAEELRTRLAGFLEARQLGAGIGLHHGPTVQGLLGGRSIRLFDVIGDTVNVAKRLCDQAAAGEILVSGDCYAAAMAGIEADPPPPRRKLALKGKATPLPVRVM